MSLLAALKQRNALRTLDHALALSLRRLRPDTPDAVLAAAALASLAVSQGHAGLDPCQPQRLVEGDADWPAPADWLAQLRASPWVDVPDSRTAPAAEPVGEAALFCRGDEVPECPAGFGPFRFA